jgi:hypothetical protein
MAMCDMYFINNNDILVRVFLQNLVGLASYWFWSLSVGFITSFDDLKDVNFKPFTLIQCTH